jgi:hypothetical protein
MVFRAFINIENLLLKLIPGDFISPEVKKLIQKTDGHETEYHPCI